MSKRMLYSPSSRSGNTFRANQWCKVSAIGKDLAVIKIWLKTAHHIAFAKTDETIPKRIVRLMKELGMEKP